MVAPEPCRARVSTAQSTKAYRAARRMQSLSASVLRWLSRPSRSLLPAPLRRPLGLPGRADLLFRRISGDLGLSVLALGGLITVGLLLYVGDLPRHVARTATPAAVLTSATAEVRRRPARTLFWESLKVGDAVDDGDALFVPNGVSAALRLTDGTVFDLDQDTLMVLEAPRAAEARQSKLAVALARGILSGHVGGRGVEVRTPGATAKLVEGAEAQVAVSRGRDREARIDVYSGTVVLEGKDGAERLGPSETTVLDASGGVQTHPVEAIVLESPERNARFYYSGAPRPVELRWRRDSGRRELVEVAQDSEFTDRVLRSAGTGAFRFVPKGPGIYYWRVVAPAAAASSRIRKLTVIEDQPALSVAPNEGALIRQRPEQPVFFSWTPIAGVERYLLELATDRRFGVGLQVVETAQTSLWLHRMLPEGQYFWRVRALDPERGDSPYSKVSSFRLTQKPLPSAPEYLDATVEIE